MLDGSDLRASVGSASRPVRVAIGLTLAAVAAVLVWGLVFLWRLAPWHVALIATFLISPGILAAALAAVFAVAPWSRYGTWISGK